MAQLDEQIKAHKETIQIQEKEKQLADLKSQLDKQTPPAQPRAGNHRGLDMLKDATDTAKHVPDNIGQWGRTSRTANWTEKQVNDNIGNTALARLGMWHNYTMIYAEAHISESLKNAFTKGTAAQIAAALKAEKLAIKDVQEMANEKLTGSLADACE